MHFGQLSAIVFSQYPPMLRPLALEIETVRRGVRNAALLHLSLSEFHECFNWLISQDLCSVARICRAKEDDYAHTNIETRTILKGSQRVKVFLARSKKLAEHLCELESSATRNEELGLALGYPECCVSAACRRDKVVYHRIFAMNRQSNLILEAFNNSQSLRWENNILTNQSGIANFGPPSFLAHYPCSFDCTESAELARHWVELAKQLWPAWTFQLLKLVKSPAFYFSDKLWPPQFWGEFHGLIAPEFNSLHASSNPVKNCLVLGNGKMPGIVLPNDITGIVFFDEQLHLKSKSKGNLELSFAVTGFPFFLNWLGGNIERFRK